MSVLSLLFFSSMKRFLQFLVGAIGTLITGGKYGSSVRADRSAAYAKRQERRRKDFAEHGGHPCKICSTRIPGDKQYCGPCFLKYVKK